MKRTRRIKEENLKKDYQNLVEQVLFRYLFEDLKIDELLAMEAYQERKSIPLFKRVAIKSLVSLHDNYSGLYARKLEDFFLKTGLADYSLRKLESPHWPYIVEGIRDLSTLNYSSAYGRIASRITYPHELVKTEVLLALIKMRGINEILKFQNSGLLLNDWVQSNILYTVKKYRVPPPDDLDKLLKSRNKSIVILAVRLIDYYNKPEYYHLLASFFKDTQDPNMQAELHRVLSKTEHLI